MSERQEYIDLALSDCKFIHYTEWNGQDIDIIVSDTLYFSDLLKLIDTMKDKGFYPYLIYDIDCDFDNELGITFKEFTKNFKN